MRDHQPVVLEEFNGLWSQDDKESTPMDHFSEAQNLKFVGPKAFGTRDGIGILQNVAVPLGNILRFYNYPTVDKQTLLVLVKNGANGEIYHVVDTTTVFGPVLTIAGMTDFGFVPYAGRAYITPFNSTLVGTLNREIGLQNEFLYVYKGDGTAARKAGGNPPTVNITPSNGAAGHTDAGVHIFGYVYETDTGYLTAPAGLVAFTTVAAQAVDFATVANSPDAFVVKKHIVASKAIVGYNGDVNGYQLFFIPGATIPNNVTTTLANISFFDADLLLDASHLIDNFSNIAAGVGLCTYHNRLCLWTEFNNISLVRVSAPGEPEAISQIDGFCLVPPNGNPLTNAAELRDVLYVMQRNKTCAFTDNGGPPASWPYSSVDSAMGCGVHGIATVIDSGSSNVDFLIVGTYTGLCTFNGRYIQPELSWKIWKLWQDQTFKTDFRRIQIVNDSTNQIIYLVMTDRRILYGYYKNGMNPKQIKWCPYTFDAFVNTLALWNVDELLIGVDQV